ncbi:AfsR/SARP family transcriptional regulator [Nocardia sp. NPDC051321]|uniref:AfsR/SARP family transcriptional regulator n=1 Tax=Nocardia sp. NPDC051321 TaxID=3364323 RepID=UPI003799D253
MMTDGRPVHADLPFGAVAAHPRRRLCGCRSKSVALQAIWDVSDGRRRTSRGLDHGSKTIRSLRGAGYDHVKAVWPGFEQGGKVTAREADRQLRFNILGSLEGWSAGARLRLGGAIRERVLVMLLLETGKVLPVNRLVTAAWGEEPPSSASHQVRKAIADLRQRIPNGNEVIVTDGHGYRAQIADTELDLSEFEALIQQAKLRTEAGNLAGAAQSLRTALMLWRGPILSGEGGAVIEAAVTALDERYLMAAEQLFELRMSFGEATEVVGELRKLVDQHPLRETLRCQLMLALYHSGRQAEALEEYIRARDLLVDELGINPTLQLTQVYEGILRESPELASFGMRSSPGLLVSVVPPSPDHRLVTTNPPCTLPYDLADFTGRDKELRELLVHSQGSGEGHTRTVVIDGMGGCGKTALAVRAAHLLSDDYPDGQLYINLHGFTVGEQPITVGTALDSLLRALGLPGDAIPEDMAGRIAMWRAAVTGKRLLLVLDNTVDAVGVSALLPTTPGCLVLITSRARLVDLDGAEWISMDVMSPEESSCLLAETLGAARIAAEPEAAVELASLCGQLPLAIRIATARLRNRPRWTLQYLVGRLRDETRRLGELEIGERSVAMTLRLTYQTLDEDCRLGFRLLALHPGRTIDVHSTAALLGIGTREAEKVLELLLDVHFVQQPEVGLYVFHDLVLSFAQSLHNRSTRQTDEAAVVRLLDYYLSATETACEILFPGRRQPTPSILKSKAELPDLQDVNRVREWFTCEHTALLSAVTIAERSGYQRHAVCLGRNVVFHLYTHGYLEEFAGIGRVMVTAARQLGEPYLLGISLSNLGVACWSLGLFAEGIEVVTEGRTVAVRIGDRYTEAHCESTLGLFNSVLGRFPEALAYLERAITHEREIGAVRAEAESLTVLSTLYEQWGHYQEAKQAALRALALGRQLGQHDNELVALTDLLFAYLGLGEHAVAAEHLVQVRELCAESKEPGQAAIAMAAAADVAYCVGCHEQASAFLERSLSLIHSTSSPLRRAKVENIAGRVLRKTGQHTSALKMHTSAYQLAKAVNYRPEEAYALAGMAETMEALGDDNTASRYRADAETLFASMGVDREHRRS